MKKTYEIRYITNHFGTEIKHTRHLNATNFLDARKEAFEAMRFGSFRKCQLFDNDGYLASLVWVG